MGTTESADSGQFARELAQGITPPAAWCQLMEACSANGVAYAARGDDQAAEGQPSGAERNSLSWGESNFGDRFAASCRRGLKRAVNQDNYFFVDLEHGNFMVGVMDGHGDWGHLYSGFIARWLPVLILRSPVFCSSIPEAIMGAFGLMSKLLAAEVAPLLPVNEMSGSTCVVVVKNNLSLYIANLGDSRAVLFDADSSYALTADHKPDKPIESVRIMAKGGRILKMLAGESRLVDNRQTVALAMSRAFGDTKVQQCGLSDEPDLKIYPLGAGTRYAIVIGSDGLWDYMSAEDVHAIVWDKSSGPRKAADCTQSCSTEAEKRWRRNQINPPYVDDITCVMLDFLCPEECPQRPPDANCISEHEGEQTDEFQHNSGGDQVHETGGAK